MIIPLSLLYGSVTWMSVTWFAQSGEYIGAHFLLLSGHWTHLSSACYSLCSTGRNANHTKQWSYAERQHKQGLQETLDLIHERFSAKIILETNTCISSPPLLLKSQFRSNTKSSHTFKTLQKMFLHFKEPSEAVHDVSPLCDVLNREPIQLLKITLEQLY